MQSCDFLSNKFLDFGNHILLESLFFLLGAFRPPSGVFGARAQAHAHPSARARPRVRTRKSVFPVGKSVWRTHGRARALWCARAWARAPKTPGGGQNTQSQSKLTIPTKNRIPKFQNPVSQKSIGLRPRLPHTLTPRPLDPRPLAIADSWFLGGG